MNEYLLFEICDLLASLAIIVVVFLVYRRGMAVRLGFIIAYCGNIGSQLAFYLGYYGVNVVNGLVAAGTAVVFLVPVVFWMSSCPTSNARPSWSKKSARPAMNRVWARNRSTRRFSNWIRSASKTRLRLRSERRLPKKWRARLSSCAISWNISNSITRCSGRPNAPSRPANNPTARHRPIRKPRLPINAIANLNSINCLDCRTESRHN
jgi:hypothetical protein